MISFRNCFVSVTTIASLAFLSGCAPKITGDPAVSVPAAAETTAVATANADAADDPAIWAPPAGGMLRFKGQELPGLIVGTDKKAGLYVYGVDGAQLQFLPEGLLNNVDLRDDFVVDGKPQLLIAASDRGARKGIALYLFDPASTDPANAVRPWGAIASDVVEPYGFCFGRRGDQVVAVLVAKDGEVRQYRITAENGQPKGVEERRFAIGSQSEGCVIDDRAGRLYVGEEMKGVWRYALDPAAGNDRLQVGTADGKQLVTDVEGVTLMRDGEVTHLVVSSQGDSAFAVWRVDGDTPVYRGRFRVEGAGAVDAVTGTDGLDGFSGPIGAYPEGLLAIQDDIDTGGTQNFKLVDWREVKRALGL
ncbi:phytase [Sphingoaurantiacus capsulatus]|uniref:Phytase n=1 Tax=Sphingoaurantiacus capsulatus TaxID=1771310 RepID=A0ABV7XA47_9SPHN